MKTQLLDRNREIQALNDKLKQAGKQFTILKGCEANILNDGGIDITDEVLAQMDYVIAGIHSNFRMPRAEMMTRLKKAMSNPHVDIISHPTGRILKRREDYERPWAISWRSPTTPGRSWRSTPTPSAWTWGTATSWPPNRPGSRW